MALFSGISHTLAPRSRQVNPVASRVASLKSTHSKQKVVDTNGDFLCRVLAKAEMNRDVYSIILGKAKYVLEVNLLNAHNRWERAYIHDDVVKGFMCCKCLLLCTRNCHPDPQRRQHLIVDSWDRLLDIHHPDNLYRVTPVTANGINAFLAAMAVCRLPGTPFSVDHRTDHVPYRCSLAYKSPVRAAVERCFVNLAREGKMPPSPQLDSGHLPITMIELDAVLKAPKHAAMIVVRPAINTVTITHFQNMMRFIDSKEMFEDTGLDPVPWREIHPDVRKRHLFLAAETPMPQQIQHQLAEQARKCDPPIHLMHKKGLHFEYVP